jgi:hypothetical protein
MNIKLQGESSKRFYLTFIRILDFDWLIAGVFSYLGLISFIFTAAGVFA